ncbi:serine/threonine protein phosphatase [Arthrobacter sp. zg-Y20]|uniref:serine/threonine protein phosphatase n=1 Tax=unclassified Arthrobacter TaxID=235627 RepID=UPI001D1398A0|nr:MULTISPECIES: serine/threonine protein phosphatase [unclassified Arthrobacter]MCC3274970.1 serine/threonine protein phosphatase [Arthrobacter sp. zg-Y20]MDK1315127.1 serine/threonine protein phosphatase [Arthrobacter sp. zg.Y20]WIB04971.1 serine/threonine protein phosphatase [Arthrobacter sp. zg-Y20]
MTGPLPPENTFDHRRSHDGEHVGYIHLADDGGFVPFDLLHRQCGEAMELDEAENLLDELGLRMFTEDWWLDVDGGRMPVLIQEVRRGSVRVAPTTEGAIAKSADLRRSVDLPLPTDRLHTTEFPGQ